MSIRMLLPLSALLGWAIFPANAYPQEFGSEEERRAHKVFHLFCWSLYMDMATPGDYEGGFREIAKGHELIAKWLGATPNEFQLLSDYLSVLDVARARSFDATAEFMTDSCTPRLQQWAEAVTNWEHTDDSE